MNYRIESIGFDAIEFEDIEIEYRDIAEVVGLDCFMKLACLCGGQNIYIPKSDTLCRSARNRQIKKSFNGENYREIARKYNLSERRVRTILNN